MSSDKTNSHPSPAENAEQVNTHLKVEGADALIQQALESILSREKKPETHPAHEEKELVEIDVEIQDTPVPSSSNAQLLSEIEFLKNALSTETKAREREEQEKKALYERFLRLNADFDNARKRSLREKEELRNFGYEHVVRDLLDVFDNFERALQTMRDLPESVRNGIEMVHRQLLEVLKRYEVVRFSSLREPFDYTKHEAVSTFETNECPPETVYFEYQAGYMLRDRLLRPARVVVSKPLRVQASSDSVESSGNFASKEVRAESWSGTHEGVSSEKKETGGDSSSGRSEVEPSTT